MRPTIAQLKATGVTGIQILVFYGILQMIEENEDGRTAAAGRYLSEQFGCSERTIRQAQMQFEKAGWFRLSTKARRYTMISRGWRLTSEAENDAESEAPKRSKRRSVSINSEARSEARNDATGVSGVVDVVHAVGTAVVDSGLEEVGKRPDPPKIVHKSRSTAGTRYEAAIGKAPLLPTVTLHVDRLFADLSGGHKYPWAGNPTAATVLADLIFSHGAPLVMAAAENYFTRGNAWTEERAWAIDEFSRQFAKLIAGQGVTRRSAQIVVELTGQNTPSTPKQLKAQLAAMRRRAEVEIDGYEPKDIRLGEDLRRLIRRPDPVAT